MLYVVVALEQSSLWAEYGCRYVLALMQAGVPLRVLPAGKGVVERTMTPEEFHPLLDSMLGQTDSCTAMLYVGEPAGAVELVSRGPNEVPDEKYALVTWPTDSLPAGLVAGLNCYDRVIVPTESCKQAFLRSGVMEVAVLPPPDPEPVRVPSFEAPTHKTLLAMGSWEGLDNVKGALHAFVGVTERADRVALHLACPDVPFDDARGLEWECPEKAADLLPLVSVSREMPDAAGRTAFMRVCAGYVSASRRLDGDPLIREAVRRGLAVAAPSTAVMPGLPEDPLWEAVSIPRGAEDCAVRGVGFDQMWGDVDGVQLGEAIRDVLHGGSAWIRPKARTLEETGRALTKLLMRTTVTSVVPGEVALRVVVPHKNRGLEFVQPCLDALLPQLGVADVVYLVDQESRPEVFNEVLIYCMNKGVSVVPSEPGPGGAWNLASARNAGARFQDGPQSTHVFFLDCDCAVPDGFIARLKDQLKVNPAAILLPRARGSADGAERTATGLAALSLQLYTSVGGYDEGYYGWGSEDVDFLWRARQRFGTEGLLLRDDAMILTHKDHPPCEGRDEHGERNEERFNAMAGGHA